MVNILLIIAAIWWNPFSSNPTPSPISLLLPASATKAGDTVRLLDGECVDETVLKTIKEARFNPVEFRPAVYITMNKTYNGCWTEYGNAGDKSVLMLWDDGSHIEAPSRLFKKDEGV